MHLFFGIPILVLLFFYCIGYYRRKKIIRKVCCLCMSKKCEILNDLLEPFGYAYVPSQDVITSRTDAWQREYGYSAFYDKAASHFGMIIDALPIYFNYDNRTWLIELWKGQYGINTGCEIGVYYADRILSKHELKHTLFKSVRNEDMPWLSFNFYNSVKNKEIAQLSAKHWWLTAFKPGLPSIPSHLSISACITLHSSQMAAAFANALTKHGYSAKEILLYRDTVTFTFEGSAAACGVLHRLRISAAQCFNRLWCKIYLFITRPFTLSVDRLLYLYYYLPSAFRRILNIRKCKKWIK